MRSEWLCVIPFALLILRNLLCAILFYLNTQISLVSDFPYSYRLVIIRGIKVP